MPLVAASELGAGLPDRVFEGVGARARDAATSAGARPPRPGGDRDVQPRPTTGERAAEPPTLHLARWTVTSGSNVNSRGAVVIASG